MSDKRAHELLANAIGWIYEHTEGFGSDDFVRALRNIGMSEEEILAVAGDVLDGGETHEGIQ